MKNKSVRNLLILFVVSFALPLFCTDLFAAEKATINKFIDQPTDLSAQNNRAKDLKGKSCALLKIWGADNLNGIVNNNMGAIYKRGKEIWINIIDGTQNFDLTFEDGDTLHINTKDFGIDNLKSQSTYLLTLSGTTENYSEIGEVPQANSKDFQQGINYFYGISTKQDLKKAKQLFLKAAEQGNPEAQYYIGIMYLYGISIEKDSKLAYEWLSAAARRSQPDAMLQLARIYQDPSSPKYDAEMAFAFFNKSAEAGNPDAMVEIGYYYDKGLYVAKDEAKVLQLFKEAAEGGSVIGQHNLGLRYYKGEGVPKDQKKAFELFNKAATAGDPFDLFNVGNMYERGIGVKKDLSKAVDYYRRSKAQGNDKATSALIFLGEE